ncbi:hypothetical protein AB0436_03570 [Streptomyces sp. NPDC051322]|uniref:hypothetical protein n=1 Tax=Streptomyces sp. NPDC051322 TaxID=3154645 RepID=UPI00344BBF3C
MGAGRATYRRILAATITAAATLAGVAACDPVDGLDTASVAYTTDRTGTSALEHHGLRVDWLTCTADLGRSKKPSPTADVHSVAKVDCQGRTKDRKDITIKGKVTKAVDGRCVRGALTGTVGGELAFRATVLGNCDAAPSSSDAAPPGNGGAGPTATVTVTVTRYPGK